MDEYWAVLLNKYMKATLRQKIYSFYLVKLVFSKLTYACHSMSVRITLLYICEFHLSNWIGMGQAFMNLISWVGLTFVDRF